MCLSTPFGPGAAKNEHSGHRQEFECAVDDISTSNSKWSTSNDASGHAR